MRRLVASLILQIYLLAAAVPVFAGGAAIDPHGRPPDAEPPRLIDFDIPAQSLTGALESFSSASQVQVLYDSSLAAGRRSSGVNGALSARAALQALLEGTDLVARYADPYNVVLVPAHSIEAADADSPHKHGPLLSLQTLRVHDDVFLGGARNTADHRAYIGVLQGNITTALQKNSRTRSGAYRVTVRLWVDASGAIQRARLLASSGDVGRDDAVTQVLNGLATGKAPPPDIPQPLDVMIASQSP